MGGNIVRSEESQEVLSKEQLALLPLLEEFASTHILVGGTAIALQLLHRKSIDFDLFTFGPQGTGKEIMQRIEKTGLKLDAEKSSLFWLSNEEQPELTLYFDDVKVQLLDFSRNPFDVDIDIVSNETIDGIPSVDLKTLGAMKVYAMMYRKKFKDLVDLYFIVHAGVTFRQLIDEAKIIFKQLYKVQYTLEALYSDDRDMSEQVEYIIDFPPDAETILSWMRMDADEYLDGLLQGE